MSQIYFIVYYNVWAYAIDVTPDWLYHQPMSMEEVVKRINELAAKAKTEGLTDAEFEERKELRNIYRRSVIDNLRAQLGEK